MMLLPSPLALKAGAALVALSLLGAVVPALGWACVGALVALAVGVALDGRGLPRDALVFTRRLPVRASLREPEPVVDVLESRVGFALDVRVADALPPDVRREPEGPADLRLPARGALELRFTLRCTRRGERVLQAPLLTFGRHGGLALRRVSAGAPARLRVSPSVARLRRYETLRQNRALAGFGIHSARQTGLGAEFEHLRLFAAGDDKRRVHWKATAKRGRPVTQVVRVERDQSVLLAVDVSHWMGLSAGPVSRLDHAVDAALFLAHVAARSGDRVGLALFAHDVLALVPPEARPGHERRLLDALTAAEALPVHPSYRNLARHLLARRLRRSLVVVLSEPADDDAAAELRAALQTLSRRHVTLAVSLRDPALAEAAHAFPGDVPALCRRLAAREVQDERAERQRRQREIGIHGLDVLPDELAVSLVNRYLDLKARGTL
jgi:uncharacterized protein (DUF58 family)